MHDHVYTTAIRDFNPNHFSLYCETNDLNSEQIASQITRSIIELALSLKSKDNKISISLILPRIDNLNNKASEVNCRLVHMCTEQRFVISTILIQFSQKITLIKASYILKDIGQ